MTNLSASGSIVYQTTWGGKIEIIDTASPIQPYIGSSGDAYGLHVADQALYAAAYTEGFHIIDLDAGCTPCAADLNNDGTLNFFDVSIFIIALSEQDQIADFNNDGTFNFFDVSAFLQAFAQGCS